MANSTTVEENTCQLHSFERNRYFFGKLMTVRDFETEQRYLNEKRHLLNRLIHGLGIVCGLQVSNPQLDENSNLQIDISEGVALDCCGNEILVDSGKTVTLENYTPGETNYIYLQYNECVREPLPALTNASSCEEVCDYNRIKETYLIQLSTEAPVTLDAEISGKVSRASDDQPIFGARIEAFVGGRFQFVTYTAEDGTYTLPVSSGSYELRASASTFVSDRLENVSAGSTDIDFTLAKEAGKPDAGNFCQELTQGYYSDHLHKCPECEAPKVLLAVITEDEGNSPEVNLAETEKFRAIVYNNSMLHDLLCGHQADFNNPHRVTAQQIGAVSSIEGVSNPGGNIDLVPQNAITISSDDNADTITVGENHSERRDNPHEVDAADTGALVSVDGVSNPGGDIDLIPENSIVINADDTENTITIGESHSGRSDNPHDVNAAQTGALVSVNSVQNPGGNIELESSDNSIVITPNAAENKIDLSASIDAARPLVNCGVFRILLNDVGLGTRQVKSGFTDNQYCVCLGVNDLENSFIEYGSSSPLDGLVRDLKARVLKDGNFDIIVSAPELAKQEIEIQAFAIPCGGRLEPVPTTPTTPTIPTSPTITIPTTPTLTIPTTPTITIPTIPTLTQTLPTLTRTLPTLTQTLPTFTQTLPTLTRTFPTLTQTLPTGPILSARDADSPSSAEPPVTTIIPPEETEISLDSISGIGSRSAERLIAAGIKDARALSKASPEKVVEILGLSNIDRAQSLINKAKLAIKK